jgi:hypothetical protein
LDAGFFGACDVSVFATAGVAAVFVGEGFAVFVCFAFVGAVFGGRDTCAFGFDGNTRSMGSARIGIGLVITATNRGVIAWTGLWFFLAKNRRCTCFALTFREGAERISVAESGVGATIDGVTDAHGTGNFAADAGACVASIGGGEGVSALIGFSFVDTFGGIGVGGNTATAVSDKYPQREGENKQPSGQKSLSLHGGPRGGFEVLRSREENAGKAFRIIEVDLLYRGRVSSVW